jgi:hypothetical protein
MSKQFHRALFLVVMAGLVLAPTTAFASHAWGTYHWNKTASTVTLVIGDNASGSWDTYLRNVEADWDQSTVLTLSVGPGAANPKNCRPTAGRVEVCNSTYGNNGWLGLAQIWLSGGHISQGTAKMNDSYSMYESEKRHVMCQEVGHTFGLGHTSEDGSSQNTCMDYYQNKSNTDMTSTTPNSHDYAELASIYSHTHTAAITPGILSDSIASGFGYLSFTGGVDTMGEEVFRSADGRSRVFHLDFGTNHEGDHVELLTHVYMAGPENEYIDQEHAPRPWIREQE